jgi:CRISPR-associated protein Csh1
MQDKNISAIGRIKGDKKKKAYQNYIEDMFPGQNYDMAVVMIEVTSEGYNYIGVDSHKVGEQNYLRYAYRKGSARGGDITFTTKFNNFSKLFSTIQNQTKKLIDYSHENDFEKDYLFFQQFQSTIQAEELNILEDLQKQFEAVVSDAKTPIGFSFLFLVDDQQLFLEDFECIQSLLLHQGTSGKSYKYKVTSEGKNQLCSICLEQKEKLHGFASPFKYATVDKPGLVSGFFQQKNNWRNYPICSDCALDFELGQKYVNQHLNRSFYGKRYFLIPQIIYGQKDKSLKKALGILDKFEYTNKDKGRIQAREESLMRYIGNEAGEENSFLLNLLFYEENPTTKAIKIKTFLEEILPSRFRTLFVTAPKAIEQKEIFKGALTIKKEPTDLGFSFGLIKQFFDDKFLEIVQKVFHGSPISQDLLYTAFISEIRKNYNKAKSSDSYIEPNRWTVLKAMLTIAYLKELSIIPKNKTIDMIQEPTSDTNEKASQKAIDDQKIIQFFHDHNDFFDLSNGVKAGIFLIGVLVRQVYNLQYSNLDGATPFEKKLRGYRLTPEHLKKIYTEALDKINKYRGFGAYQNLRELINQYFLLNASQLKSLSNDELSFYFVAGLELGNNFKTQKNNDHE